MATASPLLPERILRVSVASQDDLDVRQFRVRETLSELFDIEVRAVSRNPDVDLDAISGEAARFEAASGTRTWSGICAEAQQIKIDPDGVSTYRLRIVPRLWLLGHRRNYRVFQQVSELDIVLDILARWGITPRLLLSHADYKPRRYRVQYGETDLAFVSRMLEDAGIAYYFEEAEGESVLVLADRPNRAESSETVTYMNQATLHTPYQYVTDVCLTHRVRPGKFVQADVDWRRPPEAPIRAEAGGASGVENQLELFHLEYGSFLFRANDGGGDTPNADDRGAQRTDDAEGARVAQRRLDATRNDACAVTFRTTAYHLRPGLVFSIGHHPRADLAQPLLVATSILEGDSEKDWSHSLEARAASADFRPPIVTPRPRASGVESATVVGPSGEEIHTDEFGRVRVQFHWDREGSRDDKASCWIPVSQNWGGSSFGGVMLPRVGQEVLVDFLGGEPDRPIVMGRVFTKTQPIPYELPKFKALSGFRTETYPRPKPGAGGGSPSVFGIPLGEGPGGTGGTPPLPGSFGGLQAPPDLFKSGIDGTQSLGPDETAHARSCNEIMCKDDAGQEQMHIQAQRDLALNVKNNSTGTVGANRVNTVLGNDTEQVRHFQSVRVGDDRAIKVTGKQGHEVTGLIFQETLEASQTFIAKENIVTQCKETHVTGDVMNILKCGESTIVMRPGFIIIQSPYVFLNPGQAAVNAAVESGTRPQTAEEAAAEKKRAEEEARKQAIAKGQADYAMSSAVDRVSRQNMTKIMDRTMTLDQHKAELDSAMRQAGNGAYAANGVTPPPGTIDQMVGEHMPKFR